MSARRLFDSSSNDSTDVFEEVGFLMLLESGGFDPKYFQVPRELLTFMSTLQPDRLNFEAPEGENSIFSSIAQNLLSDDDDPFFQMVDNESTNEELQSMIKRSSLVDTVPTGHVYCTLYF
jgi:hypothetical protein